MNLGLRSGLPLRSIRSLAADEDGLLRQDVVSARVYICGLGSYELYMNGEKVSGDLLAPGHHSYDLWLQAFAYDLTPFMKEENALGVMLSAAWYKGRFGFDGGFTNIYGDQMRMIAEIISNTRTAVKR